MMGKGDGLRALHMCISRHDGFQMLFGLICQHIDIGKQQRFDFPALIAQVQANIQRNLVVPAARGMQAFACIPQTVG